ncbi:MAG: glycosyltransferase family 1 protein [Gammaproteobacteria bacterium]|nr:glycosyltransferase family 1 protein [Gammaproteobacteria bacterium]
MRIALVTETYAPELNGVARTLVAMVRELRALGHTVDLVRPAPRGDAAPPEEGELRVRGLPLPGYAAMQFGLPAGQRLRARWTRWRPDVVHIDTEGPLGYSALRTARALGIPVTSSLHTHFHIYARHYGLPWLSGPVLAYLRYFHNATAFTLIPTEDQRAQYAAEGFERLRVLGRGVDATLFHPARRDPTLRARWGADADTPVVLYVGRLAAEKNLDLFVRAIQTMRECCPKLRAVMVGDGPLAASLRHAHPDIHFAGAQVGEALAAHYASADLFVFPSLSETFGNVLLEAMASGLAVLAFDYAAARLLIDDDRCGLVAPVGDEETFLHQAARLVEDNKLAARLGQAARERAEQQSWTAIVRQLESMWLEVIDAATASPRRVA